MKRRPAASSMPSTATSAITTPTAAKADLASRYLNPCSKRWIVSGRGWIRSPG